MTSHKQATGAAERADRFLRSNAGRAAVHRTLGAQRLPRTLADDLRQEVLRRVVVATSERGIVIDNLEGFVTRALHHAAVDIVRGRIRSPQTFDRRVDVDLDADEWGWPHDGIASLLDVEADALAFESLSAVRRAIHQRLASDPAAAAAALAYLAVMVEGAAAAADCPQPAGGASPREAAEWAGLWYAGFHDCFASQDAVAASPGAVRKRRSRATHQLRQLLLDSAVAAGLGLHSVPAPARLADAGLETAGAVDG